MVISSNSNGNITGGSDLNELSTSARETLESHENTDNGDETSIGQTEASREKKTSNRLSRQNIEEMNGGGIFALIFMMFMGEENHDLDKNENPALNEKTTEKISSTLGLDSISFTQTLKNVRSGQITALSAAQSTYASTEIENPAAAAKAISNIYSNDDSTAWQKFMGHLMKREGYSNTVYADSLGKPTVGVGHLILPSDSLSLGDTISDKQIMDFLEKDAKTAYNAAIEQSAELGISDKDIIVGLASVNYQLGNNWRDKFPNTWKHMKAGNFEQAIANTEESLWNKQTPTRVDDFHNTLRLAINFRDGSTPIQTAFNGEGTITPDKQQPNPLTPAFNDGEGNDQIALVAKIDAESQAAQTPDVVAPPAARV